MWIYSGIIAIFIQENELENFICKMVASYVLYNKVQEMG